MISSATGIQYNFLNAGDNVSVTATFSEAVIVDNSSGNPTLTLVVGSTNRTAQYASGNNSTQQVFRYTIQAGENDTNGISIGANALALDNGSISDVVGNIATDLTHSVVDNNSSYKVDTTSPTANFTKATDNVGTVQGDFTSDNTTDDTTLVLSGTNEAGSSVKVYDNSTELGTATAADNGTSWSYTATVANGTTHLFNVRETDLAGNTSAATSNLAVTGDTTAPTAPSVSGITPTDNTTPTWNWSAGGGGNGTYRYKLDNNDLTSGATETTSTSYTTGSGISEGSHILYVQERDAANWSSSGSSTIVIDTTVPTITSFTSTTNNGSYNSADTLNITATASEAVVAGNTITATLDTSDNVTLTAADNGTTLVGTYTVSAGDNSNDLTVSSFSIGTVTDIAGNAMDNTSVPGTNIASGSAIIIDTTAPTITSFTSTTNNGSYISDGTVNITATASEAVVATNTITATLDTSDNVTLTAADNGTTLVGTYTVSAGDNSNDLTVSSFSIGTVTDIAGNAMDNTSVPGTNIASGSAIVIDTTAPTITSFTSTTSNGSYKSDDTVNITATASEAVVATNTITATLDTTRAV